MSDETKTIRSTIVVTGAVSAALTATLIQRLEKDFKVSHEWDDPDGQLRADNLAVQQLERMDRLEVKQIHESMRPPFLMSSKDKQKAQWKQERGRGKKSGRR